MKAAALVLLLVFAVQSQEPEWRLIKEMSGDIPNHAGRPLNYYVMEIARNGDKVKLRARVDLPTGLPNDIPGTRFPPGFDPSTIIKLETVWRLDCKTEVMKFEKEILVYLSSGEQLKSKGNPFRLPSTSTVAPYFCERGTKPTAAPTLKPSP